MNNVIARKIAVTASYAALSSSSEVVTVTLSALTSNSHDVYLEGDTGDDVPLIAGEWHTLKSVDLSRVKIKGTVGDYVSIIGGTW
ncbi:MAG: hypothetical protein JXD22_11695 [Sedimentisphaerales bacterium]|nr:hypothetical protein [Sedimentisphaerales bacterium]